MSGATWLDRWKHLRRQCRTWLVIRVGRWLEAQPAERLPRLRRLLTPLLTMIWRRQVAAARERLPAEFAAERERIVQGVIHNQVTHLLEVFLYDQWAARGIDRFIRVHGREHLDRALAGGHGAIILAAHFGGWELIGYWLAAAGYAIHAIARPQAIDSMTRFMNDFRQRRGVKILMTDNLAAAGRVLREGGLIGILADLDAGERGVLAPFFGRPASFYPTPVLLSGRYRAPLIPTFIERRCDGTHELRFEEPVRLPAGASLTERVAGYAARYEAAIRARPDHWVWFHDRFAGARLVARPGAGGVEAPRASEGAGPLPAGAAFDRGRLDPAPPGMAARPAGSVAAGTRVAPEMVR